MRALIVVGVAVGLMLPNVPEAEACGYKVAVRAAKIKRTQRSSNPSMILLLGQRDSSLARELRNAGHTVEQTRSARATQHSSYALVLVDEDLFSSAEQRFPGALIVTKRGSRRTNTKRVEYALRRSARQSPRRILDTTPLRQPTDTGGDGTRDINSGQLGGSSPAAGSDDSASSTQVDRDRVDGGDTAVDAGQDPEQSPVASWTTELTFGVNRSTLSEADVGRLQANARWLQRNKVVSVVIEGHSDTTGAAAYNMVLSGRRAETAKAMLVEMGVRSSRIETEAHGEERPAHSPGSSGKNRRIVLKRR